MRTIFSKLIPAALLILIASPIGCTDQSSGDLDDEDLYPVDRQELADESVPDEVDVEPGAPDPQAICVELHGRVTRLFVGPAGRVRAQGTVWSDTGRCPTSVVIRLTRNGTRIDSQDKHCSGESCTSRLLSAANPPGAQEFCATVRSSPTGTVLDRKCITR